MILRIYPNEVCKAYCSICYEAVVRLSINIKFHVRDIYTLLREMCWKSHIDQR